MHTNVEVQLPFTAVTWYDWYDLINYLHYWSFGVSEKKRTKYLLRKKRMCWTKYFIRLEINGPRIRSRRYIQIYQSIMLKWIVSVCPNRYCRVHTVVKYKYLAWISAPFAVVITDNVILIDDFNKQWTMDFLQNPWYKDKLAEINYLHNVYCV